MKEYELENRVIDLFNSAIKQSNLTSISEDRWVTSVYNRVFDLVIYKNSEPLALIEIKKSIEKKSVQQSTKDYVRSGLKVLNARYGILTDGHVFLIIDKSQVNSDFVKKDFVEIISIITSNKRLKINEKHKAIIVEVFKDAAQNHLDENKELIDLLSSSKFKQQIKFDINKSYFHLYDRTELKGSIENQLFELLIGHFTEKHICRYTSLDTIFSMLNNLTFRMLGLVGMNDKSEVNYVDEYLNGVERPFDKMHHNKISAINRRYISSCSTIKHKDELTLWRLYGEDGQGVCLTFKLDIENVNAKSIIRKVKYANENGRHSELDFLKQIINDIEDKTGFKFQFNKLGVWKHFFKPFDYSIEDEVRLLIVENNNFLPVHRGWIKTYSHSIINPFVDFGLNSKNFPIQLTEITLGPKLTENKINFVQLQEMIRCKKKEIVQQNIDSNLNKVKVSQSDIMHYR